MQEQGQEQREGFRTEPVAHSALPVKMAALRRMMSVLVSRSAARFGDKARVRSGVAAVGFGLAAGGAAVLYLSYRGARTGVRNNAPVLAAEPVRSARAIIIIIIIILIIITTTRLVI